MMGANMHSPSDIESHSLNTLDTLFPQRQDMNRNSVSTHRDIDSFS